MLPDTGQASINTPGNFYVHSSAKSHTAHDEVARGNSWSLKNANTTIDQQLNELRERFYQEIELPLPVEIEPPLPVDTIRVPLADSNLESNQAPKKIESVVSNARLDQQRLGLTVLPHLSLKAQFNLSQLPSDGFDYEAEIVTLESPPRSQRPMHAVHISLENGLRHGVMRVGSTGEVFLSKHHYSTIRSIINESKRIIWLGCVNQPEALAYPLELAMEKPDMTIIAAHACDGTANAGDRTGELAIRATPPNLLIARGGVQELMSLIASDDEVAKLPAAWQATSRDSPLRMFDGGCDWLLVSKGALRSLTGQVLPSFTVKVLGRSLLWCSAAVLPGNVDVGDYWAQGGHSTGLVRAALSDVAHEASFLSEFLPPFDHKAQSLLRIVRLDVQTAQQQPLSLESIFSLGLMPQDALVMLAQAIEQRGAQGARTDEALKCVTAGGTLGLGFSAGHLDPLDACDLSSWTEQINLKLLAPGPSHQLANEEESTLVETSTYLTARTQEGTPGEQFAQIAVEGMYHLRQWWPTVKTALKSLNFRPGGIVLIGNDLGMVAIKVARLVTSATVVNWRSENIKRLISVTDLSNMFASRRVVIGYGPSSIKQIQNLAGFGGPSITAVSASTIIRWISIPGNVTCDPHAIENRLGAVINAAQKVALVELPRLRTLTSGLSGIAPSCAVTLQVAYDGDELALLNGALKHVARKTAYVNVSAGSSDALICTIGLEVDAANSTLSWMSGGLSLVVAQATGLLPRFNAALLRAHLQLPLDRLNASAFVRTANLLSPEHLSLTIIGDAPALYVCRSVLSKLWPSASSQPWTTMRGMEAWSAINKYLRTSPAEHRNGHFSLIEFGYHDYTLSLQAAASYPYATILSVAGKFRSLGNSLYKTSSMRNLRNVICCSGEALDESLAKKFYESPELARYAVLQSPSLLRGLFGMYSELGMENPHANLKEALGCYVSSSLTTWIPFPSVRHLSIAMLAIFPDSPSVHTNQMHPRFSIDTHPSPGFTQILHAIVDSHILIPNDGKTHVVSHETGAAPGRPFPFPLARLDVVEMIRKVHHHFDWVRDGHKRTYTMHVDVNNTLVVPPKGVNIVPASWQDLASGGGVLIWQENDLANSKPLPIGHHVSGTRVLHVRLVRDQDAQYIPYGVIHAFTLICAFRIGLVKAQAEVIYSDFVKLPLYEDMAPWNIALAAGSVEYIDYDTRGKVYDVHVEKVYRVLSVLMNYKRTITDFGKCGESARNPYGFGQVSSCVKPKTFKESCWESDTPVPCDDGNCHTDYISCLRSLARSHEENPHRKKVSSHAHGEFNLQEDNYAY
eukprot:CAMPEP_0119264760 /NCGR_PEP_ID=MMETSP1329-20130426/3764_1 /TAXON_ID=114041 /ORGANISM="Genus nov. species nov., Strain RCC1024" /LENGTH=1310 /DNA_ID=CAMNT_0007264551 /DNA_START=450 /DNA_END=4382 /DNA_ORIENTATION=+